MIRGLPENGDVRNTVLFRNVAPYITTISINQFIYELLRVVAVWEERGLDGVGIHKGFDAVSLMTAFTWSRTPQYRGFWVKLHEDYSDNHRRQE